MKPANKLLVLTLMALLFMVGCEKPPTITSIDPPKAQAGTSLAVTVQGSNFKSRSTLNFGNGITVKQVTFVSDNKLIANLTLDQTASGSRTVRVTNPNGMFDDKADAFEVTPLPPVIKVVLKGGSGLNPDQNGNPNAVQVRIYQLKSKDRFERATFDSLWSQDKQTLADDLIHQQQITLRPSMTEPVPEFPQKPEMAFVGVVADFFQKPGDSWRKVVQLPQGPGAREITFYLDAHVVEVKKSEGPR